jgi:hypothetical protein
MASKAILRNVLAAVAICMIASTAWAGTATIGNFVAISNTFGYQGTVQDITSGSPAVAVPTPRDAYLYFTNGVPAAIGTVGDNNIVESNFSQSPESNQNPGFFQISEGTSAIPSVTSASGVWTEEIANPSLWDFTMTVNGTNATWPSSNARLWRPNVGDAPGGTYSTYTYTVTAVGMNTTLDDGWLISTTNPTSITGSFSDTFVPTDQPTMPPYTPITGDTYTASLNFSNTYFDGTGFTGSPYDVFAAPVPEPASLTLLGSALLGLGLVYLRRRGAKA